jgi:hypothetical protein
MIKIKCFLHKALKNSLQTNLIFLIKNLSISKFHFQINPNFGQFVKSFQIKESKKKKKIS